MPRRTLKLMSQLTPDFSQLSIAERIQLVADIRDNIAAESAVSVPLSPAQSAEIERRLAAHAANPDTAIAWEQVRAELFSRNH